jgi:hypothetical protein
LLALAHLRNGDTYTGLAVGFEIGVATAWSYVQKAVALRSAAADDVDAAMARVRLLAYAFLDCTLIPIPGGRPEAPLLRQAQAPRRQHAGHRRRCRHLVWASAVLPGSTHDLTAARTHGIIEALTRTR